MLMTIKTFLILCIESVNSFSSRGILQQFPGQNWSVIGWFRQWFRLPLNLTILLFPGYHDNLKLQDHLQFIVSLDFRTTVTSKEGQVCSVLFEQLWDLVCMLSWTAGKIPRDQASNKSRYLWWFLFLASLICQHRLIARHQVRSHKLGWLMKG